MTSRLELAALLALFSLVACGDNQDDAGARDLLARVRADQYRIWDRAPGFEQRKSSNAPHSDAVDIYVNDIVAEVLALREHDGKWPLGAIIVKDGFAGSDLELTAIMEKRADGLVLGRIRLRRRPRLLRPPRHLHQLPHERQRLRSRLPSALSAAPPPLVQQPSGRWLLAQPS
jgi:hypothetical protein